MGDINFDSSYKGNMPLPTGGAEPISAKQIETGASGAINPASLDSLTELEQKLITFKTKLNALKETSVSLPQIEPPKTTRAGPPEGPSGVGNPCFNPAFFTEYKSLMMEVMALLLKIGFKESENGAKLITLSSEISKTVSDMTKAAGHMRAWQERFQGFMSIGQGLMAVGAFAVKHKLTKAEAEEGYKADLKIKEAQKDSCAASLASHTAKVDKAELKLKETKDLMNKEFPQLKGLNDTDREKAIEKLADQNVNSTSGFLKAGDLKIQFQNAQADVKSAVADQEKAKAEFAAAEAAVDGFKANKNLHIAQNQRSLAEQKGIDSITKALESSIEALKSFISSIFTSIITEMEGRIKANEGYLQVCNRMLDSSLEQAKSKRSEFAQLNEQEIRMANEIAKTYNIKG